MRAILSSSPCPTTEKRREASSVSSVKKMNSKPIWLGLVQQQRRSKVCGERRKAEDARADALSFCRAAGMRRVKIKREEDGKVVGEMKVEKKEVEEDEALWVRKGEELTKREVVDGAEGEGGEEGAALDEEMDLPEKGSNKCMDCKKKQASYGFEEDGKRRWCAKCGKERGAVSLQRMCVDCKLVQASYKVPGETSARYCGPCGKAKGGTLDRMCKDCGKKQAHFGVPGEKASFCGTCAPIHGAFSFKVRCKTCNKRGPTHGTADQLEKKGGSRFRSWCAECAASQENAVLIPWPCQVCQIGERAYGHPDDGHLRWCLKCKDAANAIKLVKCEACKDKWSTWGVEGGEPSLCEACCEGKEGVVQLWAKAEGGSTTTTRALCVVCKKRARWYARQGSKEATMCEPCGKKEGGKEVQRKCKVCNEKHPFFGLPGTKQALWCGACAPFASAVGFKPKCHDCGVKGPTHGTPDMLEKKNNHRLRKWCSSCAASNHPTAVPIPWPCESCGRGKRQYGHPDNGHRRWCKSCRPGKNAVALHKCAGECGAYATHGKAGVSRDRLTHCAACAEGNAELHRGWSGRCVVSGCGASLPDGWAFDGCASCQEKAKAMTAATEKGKEKV